LLPPEAFVDAQLSHHAKPDQVPVYEYQGCVKSVCWDECCGEWVSFAYYAEHASYVVKFARFQTFNFKLQTFYRAHTIHKQSSDPGLQPTPDLTLRTPGFAVNHLAPTIAQLVERRIVETCFSSLRFSSSPWFSNTSAGRKKAQTDSGLSDFLCFFFGEAIGSFGAHALCAGSDARRSMCVCVLLKSTTRSERLPCVVPLSRLS
jgi:hypothetical protein